MATANAQVRLQLNGPWPVDSLLEAICHFLERVIRNDVVAAPGSKFISLRDMTFATRHVQGKYPTVQQHMAFV
jgi:hypothetical protein